MFPQTERNTQFTSHTVDVTRGFGNHTSSVLVYWSLCPMPKLCCGAKLEWGEGRGECRINQKTFSDPSVFPCVKWAFYQPSILIHCCAYPLKIIITSPQEALPCIPHGDSTNVSQTTLMREDKPWTPGTSRNISWKLVNCEHSSYLLWISIHTPLPFSLN